MDSYDFEAINSAHFEPEEMFVEERRSDAQIMHDVAQTLLWLQEIERGATSPLDICDLTQIYNHADRLQVRLLHPNFCDNSVFVFSKLFDSFI